MSHMINESAAASYRPSSGRLLAAFVPGPSAGALEKFYHQLAAMLRAGLPILQALDSLDKQGGSRAVRRRLPLVEKHIEDGGTVAGAFALFPQTFDPVHVAMIRAGEDGGRLDEVLERLSDTCRRRARLIGRVITALLYPILLLHLAFFAVPLIEKVQGADTSYWLLVLPKLGVFYGVLLVVFAVPRMMRQFPASACVLDHVRDCAPIYAGVVRKLALGRFARTLDGLYNSGVNLVDALPIAADACGNELIRRRVCRLAPMVERGEPFSRAMRSVGGFPTTLVSMIETGEKGGELSRMLGNAAEYYENEAETALDRAAVIIPVVVYLAVAAYVGLQIIRAWSSLLAGRMQNIE